MGFWKRLFSGSNQPDNGGKASNKQDDDSAVGVDPTTGEKMSAKNEASSSSSGPKFSGRPGESKAQKQADPETREVVKDAEEYPNEGKPRADVDAADASLKKGSSKPEADKTQAEKRKTQPKPAAQQKTTPKEAEPGSGEPKAGQHKDQQ